MPTAVSFRAYWAMTLMFTAVGCTVTRPSHLYPNNETASGAKVLEGLFVGHGQGHGTAKVTMPDGEVLHGEYSIVFDGAVGFGSIFGTVYGSGGATSVSGTSSNITVAGKGQGSASLAGNQGASLQCEFLNANMTGHGYGACRSSKGEVYRLLY